MHVLCPLFVYFVNQYAIPTSVRFLRNLFTDLFVSLFRHLFDGEMFGGNNSLDLLFSTCPNSTWRVKLLAKLVAEATKPERGENRIFRHLLFLSSVRLAPYRGKFRGRSKHPPIAMKFFEDGHFVLSF